jgi:CRISPR type I-E-associated protein CasB/Cse2
LRIDKDSAPKVLTTDAGGFGYRRLVDLLFPGEGGRPSLLQDPVATDEAEGLALLARALVRGQGKTEGYHERHVLFSKRVRTMLGSRAADSAAQAARERVGLAGELKGRVLRPALLALFQNGPESIEWRHDASGRKADGFLTAFDRAVDRTFFPDLWEELDRDVPEQCHACRAAWVRRLLGIAETIVKEADATAPKSTRRRYRSWVRALDALYRFVSRNPQLAPYLERIAMTAPPDPAPTTESVALALARLLAAEAFGTGPRAMLRRLDPVGVLAEPALQRLLAQNVPDGWLCGRGMRDWALITHLLALGAPDHHCGGPRFGAALRAAGFSETRLARLLHADRVALDVLLPRACRLLLAKGKHLNPPDLACLVRAAADAEPSHLEAARTAIARDYYRAERSAAPSPSASPAEVP